MISNLLVANRGEIARRVFRTCRNLGIGTIAVFSDPDAEAPHVTEADIAVRLPGQAPSDTYLRSDLLVKAAVEAGADAIHPGYGFLAENAAFARAVLEAGLTWVGPPPEAIEAMGSKVAAKRLMAEAGVPVLAELDPDKVTEADLPVLVKASAGGGGRGMRIVRALRDLPAAVESASAEAQAAFGDPTVFCERYVETGRHIEVQVMADEHGRVWALGERDCSIQRRHQKVLEEAPAPLLREETRAQMNAAAVAAARAVGYVGAGTVEFLAVPGPQGVDEFYFLEMNTRLQVEHPVTECVTGLDLVALQLGVAEGRRLEELVPTGAPPETAPRGHAIEARLYAEDPARDWQPQSGTLHRLDIPGITATFTVPATHGLRLDAGVSDGAEVSVHYDPLLAKLIAWAPDRASAARALASALARARIHGITTNRDLLVNVLRHPAFLAGKIDTAFLNRHGYDKLAAPLAGQGSGEAVQLSALAAALADAEANRASARVAGRLPSGWRNVFAVPQRKRYRYDSVDGAEEITVAYRIARDRLWLPDREGVSLVSASPERVVLEVAGISHEFHVARYGESRAVDSALGPVTFTALPRFREPGATLATGSLVAPMPGTVLRIAVAAGDRVRAGDPILWLEAMKMEHQITAPADGVVSELPISAGQQVEVGTVLAVVRDEGAAESDKRFE